MSLRRLNYPPMRTRTGPALPRMPPIVPTLRRQPFNDPAWLFEPKYDGFRGMVYLSRKSCTLYSKKRNVFSRFDELRRDICAELPRAEVILDGEIVAIDDEGRIDFWGLMRGQGHVHFAAFDILWLNGRDLRDLPLTHRRKRLTKIIPVTTGTLSTIMTVEGRGCDLFEAACRLDFEGIVAKRKADPYSERTQWLKIKNPTYTQTEGRRELFDRGRR
jgi:bifunctional non-homologous end joining protein LigD